MFPFRWSPLHWQFIALCWVFLWGRFQDRVGKPWMMLAYFCPRTNRKIHSQQLPFLSGMSILLDTNLTTGSYTLWHLSNMSPQQDPCNFFDWNRFWYTRIQNWHAGRWGFCLGFNFGQSIGNPDLTSVTNTCWKVFVCGMKAHALFPLFAPQFGDHLLAWQRKWSSPQLYVSAYVTPLHPANFGLFQ